MDDVLVERLWRSFKYEEVFWKAYQSGGEARAGPGEYMRSCNDERSITPWATKHPASCLGPITDWLKSRMTSGLQLRRNKERRWLQDLKLVPYLQ